MTYEEIEKKAYELLQEPPFYGHIECFEGARQMAIYILKVERGLVTPVEKREGWRGETERLKEGEE